MKAKITEIFKSIQGEGIYLGKEQIFLRFYGCNLTYCRFCDTRLDSFKEYQIDDLFNHLKPYSNGFHSISLTGGEPLLQMDFLKEFLPLVKERGLKTYLETNATLPHALKDIIEYIDIIAMDFKLPSSTGLKGFWREHKEFLVIASKKEVFVKAVICSSTTVEDLKKAADLLADFNRNIPFILQPNSFELNDELITKSREFQRLALESLADVRIVPQAHRILNLR